jgi:hypothetical protein
VVGGGVEIEHKRKIPAASLRSGVGVSRKKKAFDRKDRKKGVQRRRSENPHPNVATDATLRMGHPRFIAATAVFVCGDCDCTETQDSSCLACSGLGVSKRKLLTAKVAKGGAKDAKKGIHY